ncbi:hypothetical protein HanRHA438_Chr10g0456881 [Helianthus annuus]|nr:hypothetical protein HanRHA438_Chr10g0456881 [Helianthus annuus]
MFRPPGFIEIFSSSDSPHGSEISSFATASNQQSEPAYHDLIDSCSPATQGLKVRNRASRRFPFAA